MTMQITDQHFPMHHCTCGAVHASPNLAQLRRQSQVMQKWQWLLLAAFVVGLTALAWWATANPVNVFVGQ